MALNNSGKISLAGSTAGESIAAELGLGPTAQISLNDTAVRAFAGKTTAFSSVVVPLDFWGKSAGSYWIAAIPAVSNATIYGHISLANNGTDYIFNMTVGPSSTQSGQVGRIFRINGNTGAIQKQVEIGAGIRLFRSKEHTDGFTYTVGSKFSVSRVYANVMKFDSDLNYVASSTGTARSGSTAARNYTYFDINPTTNNLYAGADGYGIVVYNSSLVQIGRETPTGGTSEPYIKFANSNEYITQSTSTYTQARYNITTATTVANNSTTPVGNLISGTNNNCYSVAGNFLVKCGHSGSYLSNNSQPCVLKLDGTTFAPLWGFQFTGFSVGQRLISTSVDSDQNIYGFCISVSGAGQLLSLFKLNSSGTLLWQRVITTNLGTYTQGYTVDATQADAIVVSFFVGSGQFAAYPVIMKLPKDGSKTGTYNINGGTITYAASAYSIGTASIPNTTQALTVYGLTDFGALSNSQTITTFSTTATTL